MKLFLVFLLVVAVVAALVDGASSHSLDEGLANFFDQGESLTEVREKRSLYCPFQQGFRIVRTRRQAREPPCYQKCIELNHKDGYCSGGYCVCQDN